MVVKSADEGAGLPTHYVQVTRVRPGNEGLRLRMTRGLRGQGCSTLVAPSVRGLTAGAEQSADVLDRHELRLHCVAAAIRDQDPERVPSARPARIPTVDTS